MTGPSLHAAAAHPMKPLLPLYFAMAVAQVLGAVAGVWLGRAPSWLENLWAGAALATLPGYLAGCVVQKRFGPSALAMQAGTVRRIGVAALVLAAAAIFLPQGG